MTGMALQIQRRGRRFRINWHSAIEVGVFSIDWMAISKTFIRNALLWLIEYVALGKRLREAKRNATDEPEPSFSDLIPCLEKIRSPSHRCCRPSVQLPEIIASPSSTEQLAPAMTVFCALYVNGNILGISACNGVPHKSPPASPDVPVSLQPTLLQMITIHSNGIDRFPFPKFRDNLITCHTTIDEEDFTRDLCTLPSFTITTGMAPWDPKAWKIEKYFADKWGYLFF